MLAAFLRDLDAEAQKEEETGSGSRKNWVRSRLLEQNTMLVAHLPPPSYMGFGHTRSPVLASTPAQSVPFMLESLGQLTVSVYAAPS